MGKPKNKYRQADDGTAVSKVTKEAVVEPKKVTEKSDVKTDATSPVKDQEKDSKLKKRAWRDKIRKKAKKEAEKEQRQIIAEKLMKKKSKEPVDPKKEAKRLKRKVKKERKKAREGESGVTTKEEKSKEIVQLEAGRFRFLNEKLYTMTGKEAKELFDEDPYAFKVYHAGFAQQAKKWPNHPLKTIITWLHTLESGQVILDLGCGEAKISESCSAKHTVHSFDLVAVNDRVTSCDIANLPLEDGVADVAVFCLSLMGTNLHDFVNEARRCLKKGGTLMIAEVTSRFPNVRLFNGAVIKMGFELIEKKPHSDYFMMFKFRKIDSAEKKKPFGLKLNPCLYKKR